MQGTKIKKWPGWVRERSKAGRPISQWDCICTAFKSFSLVPLKIRQGVWVSDLSSWVQKTGSTDSCPSTGAVVDRGSPSHADCPCTGAIGSMVVHECSWKKPASHMELAGNEWMSVRTWVYYLWQLKQKWGDNLGDMMPGAHITVGALLCLYLFDIENILRPRLRWRPRNGVWKRYEESLFQNWHCPDACSLREAPWGLVSNLTHHLKWHFSLLRIV